MMVAVPSLLSLHCISAFDGPSIAKPNPPLRNDDGDDDGDGIQLAHGHYAAVRVRLEPSTLRLHGRNTTTTPSCLQQAYRYS